MRRERGLRDDTPRLSPTARRGDLCRDPDSAMHLFAPPPAPLLGDALSDRHLPKAAVPGPWSDPGLGWRPDVGSMRRWPNVDHMPVRVREPGSSSSPELTVPRCGTLVRDASCHASIPTSSGSDFQKSGQTGIGNAPLDHGMATQAVEADVSDALDEAQTLQQEVSGVVSRHGTVAHTNQAEAFALRLLQDRAHGLARAPAGAPRFWAVIKADTRSPHHPRLRPLQSPLDGLRRTARDPFPGVDGREGRTR